MLLRLRVFGFGLLQDGDVGVGVFPECEKIFVGGQRADAAGVSNITLSLYMLRPVPDFAF
jgi:hypothetical protein